MGIFSKQKDPDFAEIMVGFNNVITDLEALALRRAKAADEAKNEAARHTVIANDAMSDVEQAEGVANKLRELIA